MCRDKQRLLHLLFCGIIPLCNFPYRSRVRSITLKPFKKINETWHKYRAWPDNVQRLTTFTPPTFFAELFPFVIFSIEIVSAL